MKSINFIFKRVLYPSCAVFTIIWFIVCAVINSFYDIVNINIVTSLMCYFIAFFIALSNNILTVEKIPFVGRIGLHVVFSVVSVSAVVAVFSSVASGYVITSRSFYLVLILIAVYLVTALPCAIVYERTRKRKSADKPKTKKDYTPMFKR